MFIKTVNIFTLIIIISTSVYSQVLWNDPPENYFYENQSRWVIIILPPPQNLSASIINNNQVLLKWDKYWTDNFKAHYKKRFDVDALPNRFSLYRQNLTDGGGYNALVGVHFDETKYIDATVEFGKEYLYKIMASDKNYLTQDGLQRWS